jgi:putative Holliday junction resolvase
MPEPAAPEAASAPTLPESDPLPAGTWLGFDFGTRRIGVAIGESLLRQAHPLKVIHGEGNAERFAAITALIAEWQPTGLVVGLPVSMDGTPHEMTARATRFANQLRGRFRLPVAFADERLSSVDAEGRLRQGGHDSRSARALVDAVAAQLILQSYLDTAHVPT